MASNRLDREDQAAYTRDVIDAADARPNERHRPRPSLDSPLRCPNMATGTHGWWRSSRDGLKRCYYCCAVQFADGRIVRVDDPEFPGRVTRRTP